MVESALLLGDPAFPRTYVELRADIANLFSVDYESSEVRRAVKRMRADEAPRVVGEPSAGFCLTEQRRHELEHQVSDHEAMKRDAFEEVRKCLTEQGHELSAGEFDAVVSAIETALAKGLHDYGARCVELFQPDIAPRTTSTTPLTLDRLERCLPLTPEVGQDLLVTALRCLFEDGTASDRYLARLFDNACVIRIAAIDPHLSSFVAQAFDGAVVYIDTSCLYHLLSYQGPDLADAAQATVSLARDLGVRRVVTRRTVAEFRTSLEAKLRTIVENPIKSSRLALFAARNSNPDDALSAMSARLAAGETLEDLRSRIRNIEAELVAREIELDEEDHSDTLDFEEIRAEAKRLWTYFEIDQVEEYHTDPRPIEVYEHDVYHRHLVLSQRPASSTSFAAAKVWFLTISSRRLALPSAGSEHGGEVPFAISPEQFFQAMRWIMPRTSDEYEKAFVDLVVNPYTARAASADPAYVRRILSKLDAAAAMGGISEEKIVEFGALLLVDQNMRDAIRREAAGELSSEDVDDELVTALERAVAKMAREDEDERAALRDQLGELHKKMRALREETDLARIAAEEAEQQARVELSGAREAEERGRAEAAESRRALNEEQEARRQSEKQVRLVIHAVATSLLLFVSYVGYQQLRPRLASYLTGLGYNADHAIHALLIYIVLQLAAFSLAVKWSTPLTQFARWAAPVAAASIFIWPFGVSGAFAIAVGVAAILGYLFQGVDRLWLGPTKLGHQEPADPAKEE